MASQDARLCKFEADFKQQQSEMTNKIDTLLKAINDRMTRALPRDTINNSNLNVNPTSSVSSARSYLMEDSQSSSRPLKSINAIRICSKQTNDFQKDQPMVKTLTVNEIGTPKPKEPEQTLEDEFKDLHINLPVLEFLAHSPIYNAILDKYVESLELDGTKSYLVGIVKNVEVHIGKLKLLEDFYVIYMEKDPATPLLAGREILATFSVVIDCKKAKITVGEGITSMGGIGARPPYYAKKDFMDYHLPGEWEIARDAELNPFKDVLVFRKMVIFDKEKPGSRKAHLLEDKQIPTLGWHLKEIHVTWTQFGKKQTRIQLYIKFDIKRAYSAWRWRCNSLRRHQKPQATASGTLATASEVADLKKP
ncbi:MAK10-like protein [Tanacetum coccineum]